MSSPAKVTIEIQSADEHWRVTIPAALDVTLDQAWRRPRSLLGRMANTPLEMLVLAMRPLRSAETGAYYTLEEVE